MLNFSIFSIILAVKHNSTLTFHNVSITATIVSVILAQGLFQDWEIWWISYKFNILYREKSEWKKFSEQAGQTVGYLFHCICPGKTQFLKLHGQLPCWKNGTGYKNCLNSVLCSISRRYNSPEDAIYHLFGWIDQVVVVPTGIHFFQKKCTKLPL